MKTLIAIVACLMISTHVFAGAFSGTYKTMPSKKSGGWAYVKFGACKENKHLTCGTLIKAFSKDGKVIKNYEHKGKYVVWDMKKDGDNNFSGGTLHYIKILERRPINSTEQIASKTNAFAF